MIDPNSLNVDTISHAIEDYLAHLNKKKKWPESYSLTQLIFYVTGAHRYSPIFKDDRGEEVQHLKAVCDISQSGKIPREHFQTALIQACYKYGSHGLPDRANQTMYSPPSIIALFHQSALNRKPHRSIYIVRLDSLAKLLPEYLDLILYCINVFKPAIRFVGDFSHPEQAKVAQKVIDQCTRTHFTYRTPNHLLFAPGQRHLFLESVSKAMHLDLSGAELDRWTADDFKHFLYTIKSNRALTSLKLSHTSLDKCCKEPTKFPYVLELLSLPQLEHLDLCSNHLDRLPKVQYDMLQAAIKNSPIRHIGLSHGSTLRLFSQKPNPAIEQANDVLEINAAAR